MISKTLHIVWVGPHDPPADCIDSWKKYHTQDAGWEVVIHRDHTGWANTRNIDVRAAKREWNGVCDAIRYEILCKMGGIVVDADSECLQSLDDRFLEPDAWAVYEHEQARPGIIACGAMGGVQGGEFYRAVFEASLAADPHVMAWKALGPGLLTDVAKRVQGLTIFPAKTFIPEHFTGAKANGEGPIFARQHWGSTKTSGYNALRKFGCRCRECNISALRPPWG